MTEFKVSEKLKANYHSYYDGGDSDWRRLGAIDKVRNIVDLCAKYPHSDVVEIGSGDGALLRRMSDLGFADRLYSLEISESAIATINNRDIKSLVECLPFNGYEIPYDDNQFDLAILSHVIEHVEYPRKLLYEATRVAKYVLVEVPLEDNFRLASDYAFNKLGHINFYSPKTIRRLVQTCGLQVISQVVTNPSLPVYRYQSPFRGLIKYLVKGSLLRFAPGFITQFWTYHCTIICTKIPEDTLPT